VIGDCRLDATEGVLRISLSATDDTQMEQLRDVAARHLLRFAFRAPPTIEWRGMEDRDRPRDWEADSSCERAWMRSNVTRR